MYVVILAGGGGTRLRPLSTSDRPKAFLPLVGTRTLLQSTVDRVLAPGLGVGPADVTVVVASAYAPLVRAQVPDVRVLEEPVARNTAAAIALAAVAIDRPGGDVMAVLPADHLIRDEPAFRRTLRAAELELARGAFGLERLLVTLGVDPDRPATEYGYLIPADPAGREPAPTSIRAAPLAAFREKPDAAAARELIERPGIAWNAGMFLWQRAAILDALREHAPVTLERIERGVVSGGLGAAYAGLEGPTARSIDYAVMEPAAAAGTVVMGSMDVGWSDVGTWPALLAALGAAGVAGGVVEAGEAAQAGEEDLVVRRTGTAGCVAEPGRGGTMTPTEPIAVLRGARPHEAIVRDLLDRCRTREAHP